MNADLFEAPPLYRTFMVDPPWMERGGGRIKRGADRHYKLLTSEEMPAAISASGVFRPYPDAHLYLWVTNNFLPAGLWVMAELGFRYVTNFVWIKPGMGIGQYARGQHELMLFGVRGKGQAPELMTARRDLGTKIEADYRRRAGKRIHSGKPDEAYERIEARSRGPYVELFARRGRPGWDAWGDEAPVPEVSNRDERG